VSALRVIEVVALKPDSELPSLRHAFKGWKRTFTFPVWKQSHTYITSTHLGPDIQYETIIAILYASYCPAQVPTLSADVKTLAHGAYPHRSLPI
jgi:hypothetical protein